MSFFPKSNVTEINFINLFYKKKEYNKIAFKHLIIVFLIVYGIVVGSNASIRRIMVFIK